MMSSINPSMIRFKNCLACWSISSCDGARALCERDIANQPNISE
jgi:hypothetical protein